jgi:hypothetical protein
VNLYRVSLLKKNKGLRVKLVVCESAAQAREKALEAIANQGLGTGWTISYVEISAENVNV